MVLIVTYLLGAIWALSWTIACARQAVRLHRALYPRGVRFVLTTSVIAAVHACPTSRSKAELVQ
jgi:hypothetical protein